MKKYCKRFLWLLVVIIFPNIFYSQTTSDCLGAIPVCDSIYIELDSPSGDGDFSNELPDDCCVEKEQNSVWYRFTTKFPGMLGFEIIPMDIEDDYDWALFNITNKSCEDLEDDFSLLVSCNAAGGVNNDNGLECYGLTGANNDTEFWFQNGNCGEFPPTMTSDGFLPFNAFVPVEANEVFVLLIVNFSNSKDGYTLDFTSGDDVGIYDEDRPQVDVFDPIYNEDCEITGATLTINENLICATINDSDISISGPGGPYSANISSSDCDISEFGSSFELTFNPPLETMGTYTIAINEDPTDLCFNPLVELSVEFDVLGFQFISETVLDTIVCGDPSFILDATFPGFSDYLWQDGEVSPTLNITESGEFTVVMTNDCIERTHIFQVLFSDIPTIDDISTTNQMCEILGSITIESTTGNGNLSYALNEPPYSDQLIYNDLEAGTYTLLISNELGCSSEYFVDILNINTPNFQINGQTDYSISFGDSVEIFAMIDGNISDFNWVDPTNTLTCTDCLDPTAFPFITTDYVFQVIDENGCIDSLVVTIRVTSQYDIYVPNVFTPNDDGINDFFTMYGNKQLESIEAIAIYNRWGEKIYEGEDLSSGDPAWDGRFKDKSVNPGVFSWIAIFKFKDGESRTRSGSITVIK